MGLKSRLVVYTGPMFSGKSERLLKNIEEMEALTGTKALLYKPLLDTRDRFEIRSRTGRVRPAYSLDERGMLQRLLEIQAAMSVGKPLILGFDETQFFDWRIIDEIIDIHRTYPRVQIFAAGLNLDFSGAPFAQMRNLFANATNIVVCEARCQKCGREAPMTYRKPGISTATVVIGDKDIYEPRCHEHWKEARNSNEQALCAS